MNKKMRAWMIAVSGTVMTGTVYAAIVNCFSIFIIPICNETGFSRGMLNLSLTLLYIAYMAGSMVSGKVFRRFDLKKLMCAFSLIMPLLFFLLAGTRFLAAFYLVYILLGLMMPYVSFASYTVLIHDWFEEGEGTAVGIAFMGSGIGGMILNILSEYWIGLWGYQGAMRALAVLMAAVAVPVSLFLVKANHENYGIPSSEKGRTSMFPSGSGRLVTIALMTGFGITIMSQTMPPRITDLGFSSQYAASMNSLFMGALCLAKLVMGRLYDRMGAVRTTVLSCIIGVAGALSYLFGGFMFLHPVMIAGAAMATALGSVSYPVLTRYMCKAEDFASASGSASAFNFLGSAAAPFFMNLLYDFSGSYSAGYIVSAITLCTVIFLVVRSRRVKA
ncbi:MAG: MFS transporter [Bullifex sp.]